MSAVIQRSVFPSNPTSVLAITQMMDHCVPCEIAEEVSIKSATQIEQDLLLMKYHVLEMIGKGTYGAVLKCQKVGTSSLYAMKVETAVGGVDTLSKEAENLKKLNQLAPLYTVKYVHLFTSSFDETGEVSRKALLTRFGGVNLVKRYKEENVRIPILDIAHIMAQLVCVGEILERARLVLRDIKPENIVVSDDLRQPGSLKVIDTATLGKLGDKAPWLETTLYYRSPALLKKKYSSSEFPFATGCILYELLTRTPLFVINHMDDQEKDSNVMKRHLHAVSVVHPLTPTFIQQLPQNIQDKFFKKNESGHFEIGTTQYLEYQEKTSRRELKKLINTSLGNPLSITLSEGHEHKNVVRRCWRFIKRCVNYENPPSAEQMRRSSFFGRQLFQKELAFHRSAAALE